MIKQKIYSIKVYESTWRILQQIKLDKGFKSMDDLLNRYYTIKDDVIKYNGKSSEEILEEPESLGEIK